MWACQNLRLENLVVAVPTQLFQKDQASPVWLIEGGAMPPKIRTKNLIDETYVRRWRTNNWWGYQQLGTNFVIFFLAPPVTVSGIFWVDTLSFKLQRLGWDKANNVVVEEWGRPAAERREATWQSNKFLLLCVFFWRLWKLRKCPTSLTRTWSLQRWPRWKTGPTSTGSARGPMSRKMTMTTKAWRRNPRRQQRRWRQWRSPRPNSECGSWRRWAPWRTMPRPRTRRRPRRRTMPRRRLRRREASGRRDWLPAEIQDVVTD